MRDCRAYLKLNHKFKRIRVNAGTQKMRESLQRGRHIQGHQRADLMGQLRRGVTRERLKTEEYNFHTLCPFPQTGQSVTTYCSYVATLTTQIQQHPCPTSSSPRWHGAARDLPSESGAASIRSLLLLLLDPRFVMLFQKALLFLTALHLDLIIFLTV